MDAQLSKLSKFGQIINKIEILTKYKEEKDTDLKIDMIEMKWLISKYVDWPERKYLKKLKIRKKRILTIYIF